MPLYFRETWFFFLRLYLIGKTHLPSSQKCSLDQSGKNRDADEALMKEAELKGRHVTRGMWAMR